MQKPCFVTTPFRALQVVPFPSTHPPFLRPPDPYGSLTSAKIPPLIEIHAITLEPGTCSGKRLMPPAGHSFVRVITNLHAISRRARDSGETERAHLDRSVYVPVASRTLFFMVMRALDRRKKCSSYKRFLFSHFLCRVRVTRISRYIQRIITVVNHIQ